MNKFLKFFSTSGGSFVKHLLLLFVVYTAQHGGIVGINYVVAAMAVIASALPALAKLIEGSGGFFDSAGGGYIKALITLVLFHLGEYYSVHQTFTGLPFGEFLNTVWIAFVPILANALNPGDQRYGIKTAVYKDLD
jgi:hypothetical protein